VGTMARDALSTPADELARPSYRRAWRVLHASDRVGSVLPLVEGQLAAGMRPALVTLSGYGPAITARDIPERAGSPSLLSAWNEVRSWRNSLLDSGAQTQVEVVHAHAFAPGMAAVRSCPTVVYDVHDFIEENAVAEKQCEERSWLARSFRVAEQFVISRASAVVVHTSRQRAGCLERGAAGENVFLIPEPVELDLPAVAADGEWLRRRGLEDARTLKLFADGGPALLAVLLEAVAMLPRELPVRLILAAATAPQSHHPVLASRDAVVVVSHADRNRALAAADLVIAGAAGVALDAMLQAKPVLAADVPANRDLSPNGRGCLWFREGDVRDLAYRTLALAGNAELRSALAQAGRKLVEDTRAPAVVGAAYDAAYRHASSRRRTITPSAPLSLQPLGASL
jgi:glycosyltransferase involved in cell wall biosynthesis